MLKRTAYHDILVGELDNLTFAHDEVSSESGLHFSDALAGQIPAEDLLDFDDHGDSLFLRVLVEDEGVLRVVRLSPTAVRTSHEI